MFKIFGRQKRQIRLGIKRWARDKMDRLAGKAADVGVRLFIKFKF